MADPWDQFAKAEPDPMREGLGRMVLSPGKLMDVGRVMGGMITAPIAAAKRLMENYHPGSGEFSDQDVQDALVAGPGSLSPGFARAAGGVAEIGAAGGRGARFQGTPVSRLLKTEDAQNAIRNAREAGMTDAQIAEHLNSYFRLEDDTITPRALTGTRQRAEKSAWTPEMVNRLKALDETFAGTPNQNKTIISNFREMHPEYTGTDSTIQTMIYRQRAWGGVNEGTGAASASKPSGGDFELGAFGGQGRSAPTKFTADDVAQTMRNLEYENVKVATPKTGDSRYVTGDPPGNPPRSVSDVPMIRVPADAHVGRPPSGREIGNRIDMGTPDSTTRTVNIPEPGVYQNAGGEPFANPEAVEGFLRWRRGDLVSPDVAPGMTRETDRSLRGAINTPHLRARKDGAAYPDPAPAPAEGAVDAPGQLKLLSRGLPLPPSVWDQFERAD